MSGLQVFCLLSDLFSTESVLDRDGGQPPPCYSCTFGEQGCPAARGANFPREEGQLLSDNIGVVVKLHRQFVSVFVLECQPSVQEGFKIGAVLCADLALVRGLESHHFSLAGLGGCCAPS